MRVALVTVGYNLPGATVRLVESARKGCRSDLVSLVILHSRIPEKVQEVEGLAECQDVILRDYGVNRGLAKSWNEGVLWSYDEGFDVVLVVNEDVAFGEGDVDRLAQTAVQRRDCFLITGQTHHQSTGSYGSSEYCCFILNPIALDILGCFDENFFPVFCEDTDYRYRASLAGLKSVNCEDTTILHGGSFSLRDSTTAIHSFSTYTQNRYYYNYKWGGEGGNERFVQPFNDPRFTYYIDPRVRDGPFPGHNRSDHHIVRF